VSNQTVNVPAGVSATLINSGLPAGAILYNQSSANTVWVSADPSVSPGNGIPLGPLGSLTWSGGAVRAIADTGVLTNTQLTISSDVQAMDNPVAIGAAVATQLLNQGVPNVFQGTLISSGTALPASGGANNYGFIDLDVSKYASVVINIRPTAICQVSAGFNAPGSLGLGSFDFSISVVGGGVTLVIPVTGPLLSVILTSTASTSLYAIYGSNRSVAAPRIINGYATVPAKSLTQAFTQFVPVNLFTFTSNGKGVYVRAVVTGTGTGKIGFIGVDSTLAGQNIDVIDSTLGATGLDGKETERMVYIPPGRHQIYFNPFVTGTYTVVVVFTQEVS
jgi:hypothetical protein